MGQLGLTSAHTVDFELTKKYVKWLIVLAIFSVGMRIAWVFDMVEQVKVAVKNSQKHAPSPGSDSVNAPSGGPQPPVLDDKVVETFAIQVRMCFYFSSTKFLWQHFWHSYSFHSLWSK